MRVLLACEESQAVCIEFRKKGHDAFSCDIQECSGGYPEWHYQQDVFEVINMGWDMMIAFPPCTHLAISGSRWFKDKINDGRQIDGINFFLKIASAPINKICIENPIGIMSGLYRKPDQIIHPYYFGDEFSKKTCLWLKNLPPLYHNKTPNLFDPIVTHVGDGEYVYWEDKKTGKLKRQAKWYADAWLNKNKNLDSVGKIRSKTFGGIAKAMAEQWG
jgi:hypothetical protein